MINFIGAFCLSSGRFELATISIASSNLNYQEMRRDMRSRGRRLHASSNFTELQLIRPPVNFFCYSLFPPPSAMKTTALRQGSRRERIYPALAASPPFVTAWLLIIIA